MIQPLAPEVVQATQERLRAAIAPFIPEPQNREYALALKGMTELRFRNRRFMVPPIPYPAGLRLQVLHRRIEKVSDDDEADTATMRALLAVLEDAVAIAWTLIKPATLFDRLFWRYRANPFADATLAEVGQLLGFFSACRMKSSIRLRKSDPLEGIRKHSISPMNSRSSRNTSRRGLGRTGTR